MSDSLRDCYVAARCSFEAYLVHERRLYAATQRAADDVLRCAALQGGSLRDRALLARATTASMKADLEHSEMCERIEKMGVLLMQARDLKAPQLGVWEEA